MDVVDKTMHILDTVTSLDSKGASPIIAQFMAHERVLSEWIQTQYFTGGKCRHLPDTKYFRPTIDEGRCQQLHQAFLAL